MKLTKKQQQKVDDLKNRLPLDWRSQFLKEYKVKLGKTRSETYPYWVLKNCKENLIGWKILEYLANQEDERKKQFK